MKPGHIYITCPDCSASLGPFFNRDVGLLQNVTCNPKEDDADFKHWFVNTYVFTGEKP